MNSGAVCMRGLIHVGWFFPPLVLKLLGVRVWDFFLSFFVLWNKLFSIRIRYSLEVGEDSLVKSYGSGTFELTFPVSDVVFSILTRCRKVWPTPGKQYKRLGSCLHLPMKQVLPEISCVPGSVQGGPTVCEDQGWEGLNCAEKRDCQTWVAVETVSCRLEIAQNQSEKMSYSVLLELQGNQRRQTWWIVSRRCHVCIIGIPPKEGWGRCEKMLVA